MCTPENEYIRLAQMSLYHLIGKQKEALAESNAVLRLAKPKPDHAVETVVNIKDTGGAVDKGVQIKDIGSMDEIIRVKRIRVNTAPY